MEPARRPRRTGRGATPLHWYGVHAAILAGRPDALEPHAKALVRAARSSHVAGVLATAGSAWMHVLAGEVNPDAVHQAARGLQDLGLAWDASRLLAQAAARSTDRKAITSCCRQPGHCRTARQQRLSVRLATTLRNATVRQGNRRRA